MGKYRWNRYGDLEIDASHIDMKSAEDAKYILNQEYLKWNGREDALMWLKIGICDYRYIPWAIECGFASHHATDQYFMLVKKSPGGRGNIPAYGTHYARVECLVLERGTARVLMIADKLSGTADLKLVTGCIEAGERICESAVREVREETSIECNFVQILGVTGRLRTRFGKDELLFGVLLEAKGGQSPTADGRETTKSVWINMDEVLSTGKNNGGSLVMDWLKATGSNGGGSNGGGSRFGWVTDCRGRAEIHTLC